jgi:DMSO/TMAO reductase YedYZ molybdopterin-dependent catalytic subunit
MLPFIHEGNVPYDTLLGEGLAGRQTLDLSLLRPETLITPTSLFFVRTRFPAYLRSTAYWTIRVRGLVERPLELKLEDLSKEETSMGTHVFECAGNVRIGGFGLMSTARWRGVPMMRLLERVKIKPQATRVIISGFDEHSVRDRISTPGASWIFTFAQLERAGGFLATSMNDRPLTRDHGYPVRFVMPGWYACTGVKWLNQVILADDTAPATGHMKEFASRTFQDGMPKFARDFKPAVVELAATPVRVEGWRVNGRLLYRVVGIMWGGDKLTRRLAIRFNADMPYIPVQEYEHVTNATWTLWSHLWRPETPGRYVIQLKVDEPGIQTRRLDVGYYARAVEIPAV